MYPIKIGRINIRSIRLVFCDLELKHGNKETLMHLHSFWQCFYHNNIPIFNECPERCVAADSIYANNANRKFDAVCVHC